MALYDYECPGCGQTFEKRVPMADADRVTCPHCGNHHPTRKLPRIAIKGKTSSPSISAPVVTGSL